MYHNVGISIFAKGDFSKISPKAYPVIIFENEEVTAENLIKIGDDFFEVLDCEIDLNTESITILAKMPIDANTEFEAEYVASYQVLDNTLDKIKIYDCVKEITHEIKLKDVEIFCEVLDCIA